LAPDLFELFHGALETYLGVAGRFWREARGLAVDLSSARETMPAQLDDLDVVALRARLGGILARWESVDGAWRELQGASEVVLAEAPAEHRPVLQAQVRKLRREHNRQASGLQVLVDLVALVEGLAHGLPRPPMPDA
jgi:hypothetical protein